MHCALSLCVLLSLCLLYARAYAAVAGGLAVPFGLLLWLLHHDSMAGTIVSWKAGAWAIQREGCRRPVRIRPRSVALPWVIYLAWREPASGANGDLWLFADSAPRQQLRGLRVRLTLER